MNIEVNKIAGAVLTAMLASAVIHQVGNILVHPLRLDKPVYVVQGVETKAEATAAAPSGPLAPIAPLLAAASADSGKTVAKQCTSCHTYDKGGKGGVGPNLWDVVGGKKAHMAGFNYSSAMQAAAQKAGDDGAWNYEQINAFLANPKTVVPGTKMTFAGLRKPEDRANVIAFLRSLSDQPKPLP
jgi:cytochrome c